LIYIPTAWAVAVRAALLRAKRLSAKKKIMKFC
jgi:hypothetical protein